MKKRLGRWLGIQLIAAAACVASCGSPAEYMPRDGGAADGGAGRGGGGGKVAATGGHSGNAGGTAGRAGTGGPAAPGVGGSPVGVGGASPPAGTGGGGDGGVSTGGSGGVVPAARGGSVGIAGTGGGVSTGGSGVAGSTAGRGGTGVAGSVGTGGRGGSGVAGSGVGGSVGAAGRGGSGVAGSPGTGGTPGCSGTMKVCNGGCIAASECCGGCSGNTPVCSNGSCVGRPLGDTCTAGSVCTSGMCADGVCCDATCTGQCESCATTSNRGRCVATTTPRTACAGSGHLRLRMQRHEPHRLRVPGDHDLVWSRRCLHERHGDHRGAVQRRRHVLVSVIDVLHVRLPHRRDAHVRHELPHQPGPVQRHVRRHPVVVGALRCLVPELPGPHAQVLEAEAASSASPRPTAPLPALDAQQTIPACAVRRARRT